MSKMIRKRNETCLCPHCNFDLQEPVEDFTLDFKPPGAYSIAEAVECPVCDGLLTVEKITENEFEVRKGKY